MAGRRGRPRKIASQRQGQRAGARVVLDIGPGTAAVPVTEPIPAVIVPKLPPQPDGKRYLKITKDSWERFWESPLATLPDGSAQFTSSDMGQLERWILMLDQWMRCNRECRLRPMIAGSMGQPVANPLWAIAARLEGQIAGIEQRFGMDPLSRTQLGIEVTRGKRGARELQRDLSGGGRNKPELEGWDNG